MVNLDLKRTVVLLIFLLIIGAAALLFYQKQNASSYQKVLSEKEALLIINYGNGKERWFKGEVVEGMSVKDALQTASLAGNFNFRANSHLAMLDGFPSNQEKKWHCYLNDREIKEDLDKTIIQPQDKILCRYY